jgi:type IV secretion system protein TrbL
MNDLSIIDSFMQTFGSYIDSGFGLLSGDVGFLSRTLIVIDITLAGLFWTIGGEDQVIGRLVRKVLYVGAFAYILNNFSNLAGIIYQSFASLGLKASGSNLSAADLLKPGVIAATGYQSAHPLLDQISRLVGFPNCPVLTPKDFLGYDGATSVENFSRQSVVEPQPV